MYANTKSAKFAQHISTFILGVILIWAGMGMLNPAPYSPMGEQIQREVPVQSVPTVPHNVREV
jgi:hypothetical protein